MSLKLGILIPYSGEFSGLKAALLGPLKSYAAEHGCTIVSEYIGGGEFKAVEKAVTKLYYQDDVDVVIGYVGYRVMVRLFDTIKKYEDKSFIHLSLGELIPYSFQQLQPPANYKMISFEAYQQQAVLGGWVSENLAPENCLMCTSLYDSGYSLMDSFRIGYHSEDQKALSFMVLKNPPGVYDATPLFEEIARVKPAHIHVVLCGKELDAFINQFEENINYLPSLSFTFPLENKTYLAKHASFEKTYTIAPTSISDMLLRNQSIPPFKIIFDELVIKVIAQLENKAQIVTEQYNIIKQNLNTGEIKLLDIENTTVPNAVEAFEYSAVNMVSSWDNPYLCI